MPERKQPSIQSQRPSRLAWVMTAVIVAVIALLAAKPAAWARPDQLPGSQTVPTLTPTPTRPGQGPTPTPVPPTNTPRPGEPTATLAPDQPTNTPTPTPAGPLPTTTALPPALTPVAPERCWTVPTPGFTPVRQANLLFEATSEETLVVPGQTLTLRLMVTNQGADPVSDVLICNPLVAGLRPEQPTASQGQVRLEQEGLIVELGDLAPGARVEVSLVLTIPADYPLGGVIESQAWLFAGDQQASTGLLTWALPPAWLPPTGR